MKKYNFKLKPHHGGPLHYLGNRFLSLPDQTGHMNVDQSWVQDMFSIILNNKPNKKYQKWIEPFAGSASLSIAAMEVGLAEEYILNDSNPVLIYTHQLVRDNPEQLKLSYTEISNQFHQSASKNDFFIQLIHEYNTGDEYHKSLLLPFIINHSWGGMIAHDFEGNMLYREPCLEKANLSLEEFYAEIDRVSQLFLTNKISFRSGDFLSVLADVQPGDFVMLNPPYPENERSAQMSLYRELYSPHKLHENLNHLIQKLDQDKIDYLMTYGFYNPDLNQFVILDSLKRPKNYFRKIGYQGCAFGMALDQMYISPNFTLPDNMHQNLVHASILLEDQPITSLKALEKYLSF